MLIDIICDHCAAPTRKEARDINRARRRGYGVYCSRICSGLARRVWKSEAEKKEEKAVYDMLYRAKNRQMLKAKKAAYFQRTYDPEKAAVERKATMARHVDYCRRPEYREYKRQYDLNRRAAEFGEYAEVYTILSQVESEIASRATRYEIRVANGTLNKSLRRKRDYAKTVGC